MSALHTFRVMCAAIGLPVTTPVREIPGYAIVAAETLRRAIRDNSHDDLRPRPNVNDWKLEA